MDCEWTSSLSFSGGGSLAGADPAEAAEAGGDPPAGRAAAVHPEPLPGSAWPRGDLQHQPPGQTGPQGLQGLSVSSGFWKNDATFQEILFKSV